MTFHKKIEKEKKRKEKKKKIPVLINLKKMSITLKRMSKQHSQVYIIVF